MRRLAAVLLLAGLAPPATATDWAAEWRPYPTTPQVPAPVADASAAVVPASGVSRPRDPGRERVGGGGVVPAGMPLPTGFAPAPAAPCGPHAPCGVTSGGAQKRGCLDRLAAWLCFKPTTGDALPRLNPHPYVGPVAGTFACSSVGGGCGPGGCAADGCGTGAFARLGLTDRGCKGKCVPPGDDAFPGYRFAATNTPAALPPPPPYTVAKPGPAGAPGVRPAGGAARP